MSGSQSNNGSESSEEDQKVIWYICQIKVPFPTRFILYWYSFGAVQGPKCSSFLAGTKLYRITLPSVNAWLILNTFASDRNVIWYSVNAAEVYRRTTGSGHMVQLGAYRETAVGITGIVQHPITLSMATWKERIEKKK